MDRSSLIECVGRYRFKELEEDEVFRSTYSIYVPREMPKNVQEEPNFMKPIHFVGLFLGLFTTSLGIWMLNTNTNIQSYDTSYGGGYGNVTMHPKGTLAMGLLITVISLIVLIQRFRFRK